MPISKIGTNGLDQTDLDLGLTGNVGIGTSTPTSALHVYRNASGTLGAVRVESGPSAQFAPRLYLTDNRTGQSGRDWGITSGGNAAGALCFDDNTAGSNRMVIDSSGNVGIGVSAPTTFRGQASGTFSQVLAMAPTAATQGTLTGEATYSGYGQAITAAFNIYQNSGNSFLRYLDIGVFGDANPGGAGSILRFLTQTTGVSSLTERMRIDNNGNVLVGTTTSPAGATPTLIGGLFNPNTNFGISLRPSVNVGAVMIAFYNSSGTSVGSIQSTASATSYNTSSDYRLKENVTPMTGALDTVAQLNPVTYTWKIDGSDGQGFIAHELQAVVPDCVTGEKDAVDADGNPIYQGVDTSFLVATLTKAIQEQQEIIESLKARIEALENK